MPTTVQDLESLLEGSSATAEFKDAVRSLRDRGQASPGIQFSRAVPPVKALRAVSKLLEEAPQLAIASVTVDGRSGCSDFAGRVTVNGGEAEFDFVWDCAWRAEQEGYRDHWGSPDQIRAAREFGYQCFQRFQRTK